MLKPPSTQRLDDSKAEEARRSIVEKVTELQKLPFVDAQIVEDVELEDGVETTVAHKLGRRPKYIRESCVRGALTVGMVQEVRGGNEDPTRTVVLIASGYGAAIKCSVVVA